MDYNNLLNKNVLKIIGVLQGKKLYFSQIYELTKIKSKNNILKNLNDMVTLKILKKYKNKGNTFYSINYENKFSLAILQLINTIKFNDLPFERRKAIEETIKKTKPSLAILFGSTAKGNFKKQSDIDLLLVYNSKIKDTNEEIKEVASRYGVKISAITFEFKELDIKNDTIKHIIKTGYPLVGHIYFYEVFEDA